MNQMIVNLLVLQVLKVLMHCLKDQLNQILILIYRAEWGRRIIFFYAYLNDIIVSDTFRFRSRSILYSVVAQYR